MYSSPRWKNEPTCLTPNRHPTPERTTGGFREGAEQRDAAAESSVAGESHVQCHFGKETGDEEQGHEDGGELDVVLVRPLRAHVVLHLVRRQLQLLDLPVARVERRRLDPGAQSLLRDGEHEHNLLQQEHGDADEDDEAVLRRDRERYLRVHTTCTYSRSRSRPHTCTAGRAAVGGRPVRCVAGMRPFTKAESAMSSGCQLVFF